MPETAPAASQTSDTAQTDENTGSLSGLRVLDLTRILAGPTGTQLLADLGADVIKIERPGRGDDTRGWGPPFLKDKGGNDTRESAYYLCANRNKRSVAVDLGNEEGQAIIRRLALEADILVENFKVGGLKKYGLDYESLSKENPRLIYCSITGFGQTGPYAHRPGYDFLIQGMGGIMSLTGYPDEEGGRPVKVGVGIADVVCGLYAMTAILAALHKRSETGRGQHIDVALLDSQVSWLINQGTAYLMTGDVPGRLGNGHPHIVPYETFQASDGEFIIATGNDEQFTRLVTAAGQPELATDPRFKKNVDRVKNRHLLIPLLNDLTRQKTKAEWIALLDEISVPGGPVNNLKEAFGDPQTVHRGMTVEMPHALSGSGTVKLIGNPVKMSETPVQYRRPPPMVGEHTDEVLREWLDVEEEALAGWSSGGVIDRGQGV